MDARPQSRRERSTARGLALPESALRHETNERFHTGHSRPPASCSGTSSYIARPVPDAAKCRAVPSRSPGPGRRQGASRDRASFPTQPDTLRTARHPTERHPPWLSHRQGMVAAPATISTSVNLKDAASKFPGGSGRMKRNLHRLPPLVSHPRPMGLTYRCRSIVVFVHFALVFRTQHASSAAYFMIVRHWNAVPMHAHEILSRHLGSFITNGCLPASLATPTSP